MSNLFDYDKAIEACMDEDGNVIDAELKAYLEEYRDEAIEGIAMGIKEAKAEAEAIKAEEKALAQRRKVRENKANGLMKYLGDYLAGRKFSTPKVAISYRKSEAVEVAEGASVPDEFLVEQAPKIDKVGLKKALKGGAVIEGVSLVERQNIQIK